MNTFLISTNGQIETLSQCSQCEHIKHKMNRVLANILDVYEMSWADKDDFFNENTGYADGEKNESGVGLILDHAMKKYFLGFCRLSERVVAKVKGNPSKISNIVYMHQQHNVAKKKLKIFLYRQRQDTIKIVGN